MLGFSPTAASEGAQVGARVGEAGRACAREHEELSTRSVMRWTSASVSSVTCSECVDSRGLRRATSRLVEFTVSGCGFGPGVCRELALGGDAALDAVARR